MKLKTSFSKLKESKYLQYLPNFKEKPRKLSSLILSIVAFSFFGLFAINPTLSTIARLRKDLEDSKFVSQKLQEKIFNLYSLQQKYNNLQSDLPIILGAIPKSPEIPLLIGQIQTLSQENNISVGGIQSFEVEAANAEVTKKDPKTFSFAFSGRGSYENMITFL
jgi:Tfp pilus assembly protein PilO